MIAMLDLDHVCVCVSFKAVYVLIMCIYVVSHSDSRAEINHDWCLEYFRNEPLLINTLYCT